jgi:hypothetical protein
VLAVAVMLGAWLLYASIDPDEAAAGGSPESAGGSPESIEAETSKN